MLCSGRARWVLVIIAAVARSGFAPQAQANLLADAGFENGIDPLPDLLTGYYNYGVWGADNGAEVLAENGITPLDGQYMLRSLADRDPWSTTWQSIDLSPWASQVDAGNVVIDYSAWFNTPGGGLPIHGGIGLRFYDSGNTLITFPQVGADFDSDPTTWEQLSLSAVAPAGARHLVVEIMFSSDRLFSLRPGYTDHVELTLNVVPEPASVALAMIGGLLTWRGWRRWA